MARKGRGCSVEGCENRHVGLGYCGKHLQRFKKYGATENPKRTFNKDLLCAIDGCDTKRMAGKYCAKHYQRNRLNGSPTALKEKKEPDWRLDRDGYVCKHMPSHPNANSSGTILQHRYVMSEQLGRPLYPHENVHHINGDKKDNSIENLELWSTSQPSGQRVVDKVHHAINFLKQEFKDSLSVSNQPDEIINEAISLIANLSVQCGLYARCDSEAMDIPPSEMRGEKRRKASFN